MEKQRGTMIIYRSFFEAIKSLQKEDRADAWDAVFEYGFNFNETKLTGVVKTVFTLIKPLIEANIKRWESGNKPKHKQNISETEAKRKQKTSETEAKDKQSKSEIEANKDKDKDKDVNKDKDKTWRTDFEIYKTECLENFRTFYADKEFILEQQKLNPDVNVRLTLEKAVKNYWSTEAAWRHKKSKRTLMIDWKATIINSITSPQNRVFYTSDEKKGIQKNEHGKKPAGFMDVFNGA